MHICHVTTHFHPFIGGLENLVFDLAKAQAEKHTVSVLTLQYDPSLPAEETIHGVKIYRVPGYHVLKNRYTLPKKGFRNTMAKINPDIVFTHTRFFATSALAGKWAQKNKKPWIHVEHGSNSVKTKNLLLKLNAELLDLTFGKWVCRKADKVVVLSDKGHDFVRKLGTPKQRIEVIPNGVKIPENLSPLPRKNQALFFGRMIHEKGVLEIIRAAENSPNWSFELVGSGPLFQIKNLPNIKWTAEISPSKIPDKIASADLVLAPSYSEGFSLAIAEAAAQARPIIATKHGIARELISTEFLVPEKDWKALQEKLTFLAGNFDLLENEGKKVFQSVREKYNQQAMFNQYEALLNL